MNTNTNSNIVFEIGKDRVVKDAPVTAASCMRRCVDAVAHEKPFPITMADELLALRVLTFGAPSCESADVFGFAAQSVCQWDRNISADDAYAALRNAHRLRVSVNGEALIPTNRVLSQMNLPRSSFFSRETAPAFAASIDLLE